MAISKILLKVLNGDGFLALTKTVIPVGEQYTSRTVAVERESPYCADI